MANYATLKTTVQNNIKTNGDNEITGALLQTVLLAVVNSLGANYQFVGIATPSTNPGTPDQNVAYLAGPGTYANFNASVVPDGYLGVLKYNGSWVTETVQVGKNYDELQRIVENITTDVNVDKKATATWHSGAIMQGNGTPLTLGGWRYAELSVSPGQKFVLAGYAGSTAILWVCKDGNGNVVGRSTESAISLKTETITIPDNGATLFVNGRNQSDADRNATVINLVDSTILGEKVELFGRYLADVIGNLENLQTTNKESIVAAINSIVQSIDFTTSILVEKRDDATVTTGAFMQTNGTPVTVGGWEYLTLSVSPGQIYTISAVAGQSARLWLVYDSNNNRLGYSTDSSTANLKTETITIPENGATLYVNARVLSVDARPTIKIHETAIDAQKVYVGSQNIIEYINGIISGGGENIVSLDFTPGSQSYIISPFNSTYDIKTYFTLSRVSSQSGNPCFNFVGVYLVNKTTGVETVVHSCPDDITPAQFNNTYIGANHADSDLRKVTCDGHGKTYADIGSVWRSINGTDNFTIVAVIDANTLWILSDNIATYPKFRFSGPVTGTLTHVSGATHTDDIVITASVSQQFYSSLRVADLSVYVDGEKITENGRYSFKRLNICENYDVLNPASVLEKIKAGVGTFTSNPNPNSFTTADKVTRHSITYGFNNAAEWRIATNFVAYQDINITYFGFTQMGVISGTNRKMYIPKALPIGGKDFRQIADWSSLSSTLYLTSEYWENPNLPPDRWLEFSDSIGVHSGYLFDFGVGGNNRKDFVNKAFFLNTSLKCYPYGIDNKITVNGGDVFSAVVWRSYLDRSKINTGGIIATNVVEYDGKCYVYGDFNAAGTYEISIPGDYMGKEIVVFEKSDNVNVLSKLANGNILARVQSATPMYGYLVLKIG